MDVGSDVFHSYAFWAGILIMKVMVMSVLTAIQRNIKGAFTHPEDIAFRKTSKIAKINTGDPDVERVRRAHLNDLENIVPFLILGLIYTLTNPSAAAATWLFKIYGFIRITHTFVYAIYPLPQPSRALTWGLGYLIQFYMALQIAFYFY